MFKRPFSLKSQSKVRSSDKRQTWQEIVSSYGKQWAVEACAPAATEDPSAPTTLATTDANANSLGTTTTTSSSDPKLAEQPLADALAQLEVDNEPSQSQLMDWALSKDLEAARFLTHIDEKGVLYSSGDRNQPLWFRTTLPGSPSSSSTVIPTVYTLWKSPDLLPVFYTHSPVLEVLISGADLMLPGLIRPAEGLPEVKSGQLVAIAVADFGAPVAVGYMALPSSEIAANRAAKGKAIYILHTYKDYLWQQGDKSEPPPPSAATNSSQRGVGDSTQPSNTAASATAESHQPEAETTPGKQAPIAAPISPAEMDELLHQCLLQTLKTDLTAEVLAPLLPLSISTLYSAHMTPCQQAQRPLDVKKSTYKKLGKFFKTMDKRGLVKVKEIKGGDTILLSVNRQFKDLVAFEPLRKSKLVGSTGGASASASASHPTADGKKPAAPGDKSPADGGHGDFITLVDVFRPRTALVKFFAQIGQSPQNYYARSELRRVITDYTTKAGLKDPKQPKYLHPNEEFAGLILKANEWARPPQLTHLDAFERVLGETELCHQVTFPDGSVEYRKGKPARVTVSMEKKMGRKVVTKLTGHENYRVNTEPFAKLLQHACAASVTVHELPTKSKTQVFHEILAQGHQEKNVIALLEKENIPRSLIDVVDKTKK
ncbi:hypothetical protein H4R33_002307 [Dimargaris cristalligena]|nr:hypothetical protein H4R33_002307 [Dimargaris cristalligena]